MKKVAVIGAFLFLSLLLASFAHADTVSITPITGNDILSANVINSGNQQGNPAASPSSNAAEIAKEKNKVKFTNNNSQCPENCTCTGSVVRCEFQNKTRVMTVYAGKSGNVIVQVGGENMTTNVTLYKSGDKVYGVFAGNTEQVRIFPDQIKEKMREKVTAVIQDENITLDENGKYQYEAEKDSRLFGFIPVKEKITAKIDAENGTLTGLNLPWWSFLASDVQAEQVVGQAAEQ